MFLYYHQQSCRLADLEEYGVIFNLFFALYNNHITRTIYSTDLLTAYIKEAEKYDNLLIHIFPCIKDYKKTLAIQIGNYNFPDYKFVVFFTDDGISYSEYGTYPQVPQSFKDEKDFSSFFYKKIEEINNKQEPSSWNFHIIES